MQLVSSKFTSPNLDVYIPSLNEITGVGLLCVIRKSSRDNCVCVCVVVNGEQTASAFRPDSAIPLV